MRRSCWSRPTRASVFATTLVALAAWAPAAHALNFSAPSNFAVGSEPQAVAVDYFNGDAYPDLVVVNEAQHSTAAGSVMVFLGSANGSFSSSATIGFSGRRPTEIAVDDFNGDSKPDLAVANFTHRRHLRVARERQWDIRRSDPHSLEFRMARPSRSRRPGWTATRIRIWSW